MNPYVRHYSNGEVRMDWLTFCTLPAHRLIADIPRKRSHRPKPRRRKGGMTVREFV